MGKVGRRTVVHGHDDHAGARASEEDRDPLGAVFTPEHDSDTFVDPARIEFSCKADCRLCDAMVRPPLGAVSPTLDIRAALPMGLGGLEIASDRGTFAQTGTTDFQSTRALH